MSNNLLLHLRPTRLPEKTLRFTHTFGLGGMSLVLFLLLVASGILLMFVYEPSVEGAHDSIAAMQDQRLFGKLVRSVHYWSANLLIAVVFLHLLRVFLTGGHLGPRKLNWVIGLALLLLVVIANFTGYLQPWDQLSYWAITICLGMVGYVPWIGGWLQSVIRGGPEIGQATLTAFYALHTTVVPVLLVATMAWHFWRVRKARGVVVPRTPAESPEANPDRVLALPYLLLREVVVALCLVAFVMVVAVSFNAPLGEAANPGMSPNPAKAPWYFLGIQEMLLHFHPLFAVVILPAMVLTGLIILPYVRIPDDTAGVWFMSARGRRLAWIAAATALVLVPAGIVLDELWLDFGGWLPAVPRVVSTGLLPATIATGAVAGFYAAVRRIGSATRGEAVQASLILLTVAFVVLTATGVFFRGPGMALVWP